MQSRSEGKSFWNTLIRLHNNDMTEINIKDVVSEKIQDIFYKIITEYFVLSISVDEHMIISGQMFNSKREEVLEWILENCKGEVWYYQTRFWFKHQSDLLLFKMRWQ